jgi:chemotaxis protein methyltransferase CheR
VQRYLKPGVGQVEIAPYLTKLCEGLTSSMIFEAGPLALVVRGGKGTVTSEDAVSLGLIVTELVINALKHAFPENRAGRVTVRYDTDASGWTLSVADDGVGVTLAAAQARSGLGVSIVEALARQLDAEVVLPAVSRGFRTNIVHATRAA